MPCWQIYLGEYGVEIYSEPAGARPISRVKVGQLVIVADARID